MSFLRPVTMLLGLGAASMLHAMSPSEALLRAADHDPVVAVSDALFAADSELGTQVRGTLRPELSATGRLARNRTESESEFFGSFQETFDDYSAGIEARQPVYRFDWGARNEQAQALDASARAALDVRQQAFGLRIAERYFAVLTARESLRLAKAEARAIEESLSDSRKRFEVGLVAGTDLKEAQARSDLASARIILARQALTSAQDALQESTGKGYVSLPALPDSTSIPGLEPDGADAWVATVLADNPEIAEAQEALVIARADARSARADILPRVDAVASYRHADTSESVIGSERDEARIGLELEVPIYAGGIGRSREREAAARADMAERRLRLLESGLERETRQLFSRLQAAYVQEKALAVAVTSAQAARQATQNGYAAGTRTITDVLNARSAVIAAQRDYKITRYNLLLDRMRLQQLAGSLGKDDFEELDRLLSDKQDKPDEDSSDGNSEG